MKKFDSRKIEFVGEHKNDSLIIGNYGNVQFFADGKFDLAGLIYSRHTVEFTIRGNGLIKFHGFCKKIIFHIVKGSCLLDFSELSSREVICFSLRDQSRIMLGPTRVITRANIQDDAVFNYPRNTELKHFSIVGKGRIENTPSRFVI